MVDFDRFVMSLGAHAGDYAPEQLKQLHGEVRKLAKILLAIHESKARSPHTSLDQPRHDRTMEETQSNEADGSGRSSR
jgi:hypothetical protein